MKGRGTTPIPAFSMDGEGVVSISELRVKRRREGGSGVEGMSGGSLSSSQWLVLVHVSHLAQAEDYGYLARRRSRVVD